MKRFLAGRRAFSKRQWGALGTLGLIICGALAGCGRAPSTTAPSAGPTADPSKPPAPAAAGALELTFTYGSEKEEWIKEVTADFNRGNFRTPGGRPVRVQAFPMGSGECMDELIEGTRKAHLSSPASAAYIELGNARWRAKSGGKDLIGKTDNLLLSPVVIAMWQPMAEALGWPGKPVGWADVLALAKDPQGWAGRGHPEWGAFKFGHTHPEFSNSGLISLLAETYAAAGKKAALSPEDVGAAAVAPFLAGIERAVVHYGSSTGFFGKRMFAGGPSYLSAAVLYENMVVESYGQPNLPFPVVAIYPKEGTFWSDHPVGVVEREWVTPEHREAAKVYVDYLLAAPQQARALPHGFRPASVDVPVGAPIDTAHGADPREPKTTLPVPPVEAMNAILALWKTNKKPADVTLVMDVSGSMNEGGRIQNARAGAQQLIAGLDDRDRFSMFIFSNQSRLVLDSLPLANGGRARANAVIGGLIADGGTALYDTILEAHRRELARSRDNAGRIAAIVVLTDGEDTDSRTKLDALLAAIRTDRERAGVRVFTIAYGQSASGKILGQIADATQAKSYAGTPENIRTVFRDIATFF